MNMRERGIRRVLGPTLASLLLVLSVAVPVFERADLSLGTVVEGQHAPGSCPTAHDHTVCTQLGGSASLPGTADLVAEAPVDHHFEIHTAPTDPVGTSHDVGHPTRGPPQD